MFTLVYSKRVSVRNNLLHSVHILYIRITLIEYICSVKFGAYFFNYRFQQKKKSIFNKLCIYLYIFLKYASDTAHIVRLAALLGSLAHKLQQQKMAISTRPKSTAILFVDASRFQRHCILSQLCLSHDNLVISGYYTRKLSICLTNMHSLATLNCDCLNVHCKCSQGIYGVPVGL